jgi:hypothetical protein
MSTSACGENPALLQVRIGKLMRLNLEPAVMLEAFRG